MTEERQRHDFGAEVRKHRSPAVRAAFVVLGTLFVGLAVLGIALPLLPTTPFLLLAAACYARASTRFYNRLLNNSVFGPLIIEWRRYRSIPYRTKILAIALMAFTLATSIIFFVSNGYIQMAVATFGIFLALYLYRIPSRDRH